MDKELNSRWMEGRKPFDGVTVHLEPYVFLSDLLSLIVPVADILQENYPDDSLLCQHDWHEHDGYVQKASPSSWEEIRLHLVTASSLTRAKTGDTYVRKSFSPVGCDFLLRIYIPVYIDNPFYDDDKEKCIECGIFDVTCTQPISQSIYDAISGLGIAGIQRSPAKAYFDKRYGR